MGTGGVLGCGGWEPPEAKPPKLDIKKTRFVYVFLEFICLFWLVLAMENFGKNLILPRNIWRDRMEGTI